MLMNIAFKAETHRREFEMLKTWDTHTLERVVCLLPLTTLGWFPPQFSYKLVPSSSLFFPQNSVFPHAGSLFLASGYRWALHSALLQPELSSTSLTRGEPYEDVECASCRGTGIDHTQSSSCFNVTGSCTGALWRGHLLPWPQTSGSQSRQDSDLTSRLNDC